jgi:hypothetical protein
MTTQPSPIAPPRTSSTPQADLVRRYQRLLRAASTSAARGSGRLRPAPPTRRAAG